MALGRALMIKPSVLMLDEPTAGVSPIVMDELFDHIKKVKQTNVAIIMVEQNAKQALSISDRGYVLVTGENRYSGTGKELLMALIHISEPTRLRRISYAVFCLKKKKTNKNILSFMTLYPITLNHLFTPTHHEPP